MKKLATILMILSLTLTACGSSSSGVTDLMEDVPARVVCLAETPDSKTAAADFAVRLLQNTLAEEGNTLVSPLSVLSALAMTANGAEGETLAQMEETLGMTVDDMNAWVYSFLDGRTDALTLANSIWFTEDKGFTVDPDFLETNANYYQADIYQAVFDEAACDAINSWVSEKTDGEIEKILDNVSEDAVMYLVNALLFDAQWNAPYDEFQVEEGIFTREDGTQQKTDFMYSEEGRYLEDENATGFWKSYYRNQYAFIALLPNEGVSVADYVATLSGEHLLDMIENSEYTTVHAALPKFEASFNAELSDTLKAMGMRDAFDEDNADFSGLGTCTDGNIFISRVLHKTHISVAEQGTKAGAATVVEMVEGTAYQPDYKTVTLNRPFVYMIFDCNTLQPIFLGTLMDAEG